LKDDIAFVRQFLRGGHEPAQTAQPHIEASFGSFPMMIMSANLVASLPVASFVTFQIEMADRSPAP
jgi:hypothetical protein